MMKLTSAAYKGTWDWQQIIRANTKASCCLSEQEGLNVIYQTSGPEVSNSPCRHIFLSDIWTFEPERHYISFLTSGMDNRLTWRHVPGERIAKRAERQASKTEKKKHERGLGIGYAWRCNRNDWVYLRRLQEGRRTICDEVSTVLLIKMQSYVMTPCGLVISYWPVRGFFCLRLQSRVLALSRSWRQQDSSKCPLTNCQSTWCHGRMLTPRKQLFFLII